MKGKPKIHIFCDLRSIAQYSVDPNLPPLPIFSPIITKTCPKHRF